MSTFVKDLEKLINKHSMESVSDTPDFILASYLLSCLLAFDIAATQRDKWYGKKGEAKLTVESEGI